jgi:hypothetical protein
VKKLTPKDWVILVIGAAIVGGGVYFTIGRTGAPGTDSAGMAPHKEASLASASLNLSTVGLDAKISALGINADGGFTTETKLLHFFNPDPGFPVHLPLADRTYLKNLPHRYPTVSGTNISTLIHRGYSPLMVPAKRDYAWLVNPPSEAEFEG